MGKYGEKKKQQTTATVRKSIRTELLVQIGRLIVVVLVAVAFISIAQMWYIINSDKETELTLESQSMAYQLADFFDGFEKMTAQMAVNPEIKALLSNTGADDSIRLVEGYGTVFNNLKGIANTDKENILATWVGDIDASVLTQSDGFTSAKGWDITERPWFECTKTGESMLTEPYIDASTGQLILSAASPVYNAAGKVIGVAGIDLLMNHVTNVMQEQKIGEEGYVILISPNGQIVFHPDNDNITADISELDISDNVVNAVRNAQEGFMQFKENGVKKYGYLSSVGENGFLVLSSLPASEYFSQINMVVMTLIAVFVVGMVLIIFGMTKEADKIVRPVQELNATAQQLAEGNLDVSLELTLDNEIGALAKSIAATVARLKEYIIYIDEISDVLAQMADGKLSITLRHDYVGEFSKVKEALLNISSSMTEVMTGINESAAQVSAGADELAKGSQSLAEGAGTQAAAVEELLATITTVVE